MKDPWGRELTKDEVSTARRLAAMTGRPAGEIVRLAHRSRLEHAKFQIVVALATTTLEIPPGETLPPGWQDEGIAQYALTIMDLDRVRQV